MAKVTYAVVEHDGGWAYKVGETFSETYPSREAAHLAAVRAAQEQVQVAAVGVPLAASPKRIAARCEAPCKRP